MQQNAEAMTDRKCPVCGGSIIGRADKKYCSDGCRIYYNNNKIRNRRAQLHNREQLKIIRKTLLNLDKADARSSLKIIARVGKLCEILTTFRKR